MNRRSWMLAVASGCLACAMRLRAQPSGAVKRLAGLGEGPEVPVPAALREQWRSVGWVLDENLIFERHFARQLSDLPAHAAKIVEFRPDLVVTFGTPAAQAMKRATSTIPVMFNVGTDPVESGLVKSLGRPGGNLTGLWQGLYDDKKLQLIKEVQPRARVVAYPENVGPGVASASEALGLTALGIPTASEADLPRFFAELSAKRVDAVVLPPVSWFRTATIERLAAEFLRLKLPAIGHARDFADAGGLMSFAFNVEALTAVRLALFDRLLRGANPADEPVQRPTRYDLVINLKTASALGLTIPRALQLRAEDLIR